MNSNYTRPVVALALCAVSDLGAVPLLVSTKDGPPAAVGGLVAVLGVLTAAAALGLARNATWARPLAWTTRVADLVAALPAAGAGEGIAVAAGTVTIALSAIAIVLLIRDASSNIPVADPPPGRSRDALDKPTV
jgi:hypothetical protein